MSDINRSDITTSDTLSPEIASYPFVAVPADLCIKLTPKQLLSVFGGTDRLNAERDPLKRLALYASSEPIYEQENA